MPAASLTDSELPDNVSATPAKVQAAYAGPTFHASPAPSALPMPKFLSKSVPAKPRAAPPTSADEGSDSASSPTPSPPSPSRAPISVPPRHEDSPLDMLFRADRAEKARNGSGSPASAIISNSPSQSVNGEKHHYKQNSSTSLNAMFPIELDAESKDQRSSQLPAVSPVAHRSITAPSKLPQTESTTAPGNDSAAIQDLLSRLSQSQKKPTASTPPRTVERVPSEPSSRHQTPSPFHDGRSPFRSASGPTTPAPATQEQPDFFYGNRNLSPLFKAAKQDSAKRNSGLRTEITADSPIMPQEGFAPANGPSKDPNATSRDYLNNAFAGPTSSRRGSAPQIQPFKEMPNNRKTRTPNRRSYQSRPDSYPHANSNGITNGNSNSTSTSKPSAINPFIPASVQAKKYSSTPPKKTPTPTSTSDPISLEQDLKRLLNLNLAADTTTGVR